MLSSMVFVYRNSFMSLLDQKSVKTSPQIVLFPDLLIVETANVDPIRA